MKLRRFLIPLGVLLVPLFLFLLRGSEDSFASGGNPLAGLAKMKTVLEIIRELYVEPPDVDEVVDGAIRGMLYELDPHSAYISSSEIQKVTEDFKGEFEGIGIYFVIRERILTVVSAIPGTPSDRLGLSPGDQIVEIEGESTYGITNDKVQRKLKGPRGTQVSIRVRRPGLSGLLDFTITREKIPIRSVESAFLLEDGVGYVRLNRFMATTEEEVRACIQRLLDEGMSRLLLDLRNNSGGYLDQARRIADLFIPGGRVIVSTEGRLPQFNEVLHSTDQTTFEPFPLIVLINHGSASASEIVAGAVQDLDRGLVAGRTSFGKGLVQRQFSLRDSSAVRVTIARYYTPSHRLIQRSYDRGLASYYSEGYDELDPNLDADSTLQKPEFRTAAGRLVYGGGGITPDVRIRSGRLSAYTSRLRTQRTFFDFANSEAGSGELRDRLAALDFDRFLADYQPEDELLRDFVDFVGDKVEFDEEGWRRDLRWIKGYIKRELARVVWGRAEALRVDVEIDPAVGEALLLFDEAERVQALAR